MNIIAILVDELPVTASYCPAIKNALVLPGINSHLIRVYCKFDLNGTRHQLMSVKEYNARRCPDCPLVVKEAQCSG